MSLLSDKAAAWSLAISRGNSPVCHSNQQFISEMLRVFDHPLQGKEAGSRLLSLRQGTNSASNYAIDFRILAAKSGWDKLALQGIFRRGLSEELKDELAARDDTSSLEELISLTVRLDNRLRERRRERTVRGGPQRGAVSSWNPSDAPPPHRESFTTSPAAATSSSTAVSEEPMLLGRTRLTPEERQRRLRQGLCLYCGQTGHIRSDCQIRPKDQAHQPPEGRW